MHIIPESNGDGYSWLVIILAEWHAYEKLDAIGKENHIDVNDANALAQLAKEHKEAAFYCGKIHSARYILLMYYLMHNRMQRQ
jgi:hypothetical protein